MAEDRPPLSSFEERPPLSSFEEGSGPPSTAEDIVKSTGAGLGQSVTGLAGLPGDVAEYGARGIDWGVQKVGKLTGIDVGAPREPRDPTYGSEAIQKGAENLLQLPEGFYEPNTPEGRAAKRVGEFLPAVIGGPGSIAARVARRAIVPGVIGHGVEEATGSETAGDVAGLAAGLKFGLKRTQYATPTYKELEDHGDKLFKSQIVKDVRISPNAVGSELGSILTDLEKTIDPDLMKGTVSRLSKERALHAATPPGAMSALTKVKPSAKADVTIDDLSTLRKDLSRIAGDYSAARLGEDRMAASIAIGKIDEFLGNLNPASVTAGDINRALPILKEARDTWATKSRMEMLDKKIVSAALRAGSTYSGQNLENAIRQNLRRIIDPDSPAGAKLRRGWSEEELARAKDIVDGSLPSNALRMLGNKLSGPHGVAGGAVIAAEGLLRGDLKTAAAGSLLPTIGYGLKEFGNVRTYRKAQELKDVLAQRAPLTQKWKQEGRKVPLPFLPSTLGTATYLTSPAHFKKGGRVTKTFRYADGGKVQKFAPGGTMFSGDTGAPPAPPPIDTTDPTQQTPMIQGEGAWGSRPATYFDQTGSPPIESARQVAGEEGISLGQLAGGFLPHNAGGPGGGGIGYNIASDKGGFFTVEDLYGQSGTPALTPAMGPSRPGGPGANMQVTRQGAVPVPSIATFNQQMPSTNNWRLLGMGPGWIMRNGFLINTQDPAVRSGLPAGASNANPAAAEHGSQPISVALGTGSPGFPSLWTPAGMSGIYYWPGATQTIRRWGGDTTARGGRIPAAKGKR